MTIHYSIITFNKTSLDYNQCDDLDCALSFIDSGRVTWLTLNGVTPETDRSIVARLLDYFRLNPALVNSIFDAERQHFEGEYDDCLYLTRRAATSGSCKSI